VPPPTYSSCLFAIVRMDEWVLIVGIAIPVLCIAGLVLWHLVGYLAGKLVTKPKVYRHALEPPPPMERPDAVAKGLQAVKRLVAEIKNDPEQLQRFSAALEDSLAEMYLELAESWLRADEHEKEAVILQKILQSFPNSRHALAAQDRLQIRQTKT
jgi:hypothetical protein